MYSDFVSSLAEGIALLEDVNTCVKRKVVCAERTPVLQSNGFRQGTVGGASWLKKS